MDDWYHIAIFSSSVRDDVTPHECVGLLREAGIASRQESPRVLCGGRAFEIPLARRLCDDRLNTRAVLGRPEFQRVRGLADARRVDVNVVPSSARPATLLLADMDSTIITSESLDDMAVIAGLEDEIVPVTRRAMRGEIDFEQALVMRVRLLKGLDADLVARTIARIRHTDGADTLVATMRARAGARCVIVSGGFTAIAAHVAGRAGFHECHANELGIESGRLTGEIVGPVLDRGAKLEHLHKYSAPPEGDGIERAAAIGDGANDIDMLGAAGLGVAFHAKPAVRAQILHQLNHTDLTGALYLQRYGEDEFVHEFPPSR